MSGPKFVYTDPKPGTPYRVISRVAIAVYGGKCEWCGVEDVPLEFDHIFNDGAEHRQKERPNAIKRRIAQEGKRLTDVHLQLLCVDCHRNKSGLENGINRLKMRGVHVTLNARPVSDRQIRSDAQMIVRFVLECL